METRSGAGIDSTAGSLAIEFQHTELGPSASDPGGPAPLNDYADLVSWARRFGVIEGRDASRFRQLARRDPSGATATYARALHVREILDEVFRAISLDRAPSADAVSALGELEAEGLARAVLVQDDDRFDWSWAMDRSLDRPLWPVVHDATRLLVDGPLDRVKACDGCRYLFIDESKNRSRRWCDMSTCGTAEKMRRYVEKRAVRRAMAANRTS